MEDLHKWNIYLKINEWQRYKKILICKCKHRQRNNKNGKYIF